VRYQARVTGTAGCSVRFFADKDVVASEQGAGKPGPYLEGPQGRMYALTRSEGLLASGGNVGCDTSHTGTWFFGVAGGDTSFKLRYPNIPPVRVLANPPTAAALPVSEQPLSVIPVESSACTAVDNQPCKAAWEIGPYGVMPDGVVVFFALRYQGTGNCQVNWQADLDYHKAAVARGERGIRLEIIGDTDLLLASTSGVAAVSANLPCGQVHYGSWKFTSGNVPKSLTLIYPDLPPVAIPIKP
jgi:hypothetical protein